jgi:hypothetical protein
MAARFTANNLQLVPNPNDVLFGRGKEVNNHEGNVRFRMFAQERLIEYSSCKNKRTKDAIARQIVEAVDGLGGRFLRKAVQETCLADEPLPWMIVDEEAVLSKVKQTFRDLMAASRRQSIARAPTVWALESAQDRSSFHDEAELQQSGVDHLSLMQAPHQLSSSRPFECLETAQLQHLTTGFKQQIDQQQEQQKNVLALFGQQRAILASQLLEQRKQASRQQFMPFLLLQEKGRQPISPRDPPGLQEALLGIQLARQASLARHQRQSNLQFAALQPEQQVLDSQTASIGSQTGNSLLLAHLRQQQQQQRLYAESGLAAYPSSHHLRAEQPSFDALFATSTRSPPTNPGVDVANYVVPSFAQVDPTGTRNDRAVKLSTGTHLQNTVDVNVPWRSLKRKAP